MARSPLLYRFTLAMTALYALLGLFLIFWPDMQNMLPGWKHIVLGLMLIAYAFIRMKRLKDLRNRMDAADKS
ncbi:MAG: hypothetical protein ACKOQY_11245 [Bacteroidota bacterium]